MAIVLVQWVLTGDTGLHGKAGPPRTGILRHVVTRAGDRWMIGSSQNTDIVPSPNAPAGV